MELPQIIRILSTNERKNRERIERLESLVGVAQEEITLPPTFGCECGYYAQSNTALAIHKNRLDHQKVMNADS